MMDRNTIIGFILIFAVFFGFSYLNRPTQEQLEARKHYQDSINAIRFAEQIAENQLANFNETQAEQILRSADGDSAVYSRLQGVYGSFYQSALGEEELIVLENDLIHIQLSTKGGRVYSAQLKKFDNFQGNKLTLFEGNESSFNTTLITANNRIVNTRDLYFKVKSKNDLSVTLSLETEDGASLDFTYAIHSDDYMVDFTIASNNLSAHISPTTTGLDFEWNQKIRQQEKGRQFEQRYSRLTYKYLSDDVEQLREAKDDSKDISNKIKWIGYKDQFFTSALIAQESFEATQLSSKSFQEGDYLKEYSTTTSVAFDPRQNKPIHLHYYFGPIDYKLLKSYDKTIFAGQDLQLEKLVPLGWWLFREVNKYFIIPIFDWLTGMIGNLGLAIFLLTLIVRLCIFPLTYKSLMSSAKMRVLKPQITAISEKHPGQENAMIRQQKTMELYNQMGINPMAGCLPMLVQMPILLALFWFFPCAIELRHESFLWATDLSTYDSIIHWNTYIPIVSKYFGNHISIFCLLMCLTQILSTKYTMEQQSGGSEQMPGMKLMMYTMPIFMFFILNSYPAGLNYYYFISTLITVGLNAAFRFFVNEKVVLAKLEAYKKNPKVKKKSGFMQRLEEAQRQQQALMKEQQKKQNKKR
ncbi:membrane protein insertase YidC [Bacteroidales bacterium OttesenSCG-928-A17]|nr:membrane protein insertase YidC [Bacteroidales bacterium OttesenSCG-928-A17]